MEIKEKMRVRFNKTCHDKLSFRINNITTGRINGCCTDICYHPTVYGDRSIWCDGVSGSIKECRIGDEDAAWSGGRGSFAHILRNDKDVEEKQYAQYQKRNENRTYTENNFDSMIYFLSVHYMAMVPHLRPSQQYRAQTDAAFKLTRTIQQMKSFNDFKDDIRSITS